MILKNYRRNSRENFKKVFHFSTSNPRGCLRVVSSRSLLTPSIDFILASIDLIIFKSFSIVYPGGSIFRTLIFIYLHTGYFLDFKYILALYISILLYSVVYILYYI